MTKTVQGNDIGNIHIFNTISSIGIQVEYVFSGNNYMTMDCGLKTYDEAKTYINCIIDAIANNSSITIGVEDSSTVTDSAIDTSTIGIVDEISDTEPLQLDNDEDKIIL